MNDPVKALNKNAFNLISRILLVVLVIWVLYGWLIPLSGVTHRVQVFSASSLVLESFWLLVFIVFLLLVTARPKASVWLGLVFYLAFIAASVIKIKFLDAPLMPVDFIQLDDLLRTTSVVLKYIWIMLLVLLLMGLVVYFIIKSEKAKPNTRWPATVFLLLFTVVITQWNDPIRVFLKKEKLLIKKNTNLVVRFTRNGYLNFFMQALFLQTKLAEPHGYSPQRLQSIKQKHNLGIPGVARYQQPSPDNIIVILAESFVDPNELGWQTSEPVLKEFNDMRADYLSGHVVVPVYGGKSINTEFELLTGLTTYFTPIESLPFRELVSDNTPSIAHTLKPFGFHTSVIQMVQLSGFGFERIYDYLGFDNKYSLVDPTDPKDPTGRHVSSKTLAMKINAITAVEEKSFIYTFANSSHMPWELSDYPDNKLKLTNPGTLSQSKQDELVAYFNALRHVESLLVELVAFYQASDEKTLIVLVGDHHPSLQLVDRQKKVFKTHENYVVPFLLWQNYDSKSPSENPVFLSMNFLSSLVLKAAHVESTGFFKFNAILMEQLKVVSARYPFVSGLTEEQKILLDEYQVMQYHILMD